MYEKKTFGLGVYTESDSFVAHEIATSVGELGRAGFKCVEALGRIIITGPYPPSYAIIYMHLHVNYSI